MSEIVQPSEDVGVLRDPVLLSAFAVRRRAGRLPTQTLLHLVEKWSARPVAAVDCEGFYDLTVRRPDVNWNNDRPAIDWPATQVYLARPPGSRHDFLLMVGFEPNFRWKAFVDGIARYADGLGVKTMVNLRCLPATVPHTRPAPVIVNASDPELELRFGVQTSSYSDTGPADVGVALSAHVASMRWHTADLTVLQPEYFPRMPNAQASLALIKLIDHAFGSQTNLDSLREDAEEQLKLIDASMAHDSGARASLAELEARYERGLERMDFLASEDERAEADAGLPTSAELIEEIERLLGGDSEEP